MDELVFNLCCLSNRGLLCGSLSKELDLDGEMLVGCKLGHAARKPVFGVSIKASFNPVSSATKTI